MKNSKIYSICLFSILILSIVTTFLIGEYFIEYSSNNQIIKSEQNTVIVKVDQKLKSFRFIIFIYIIPFFSLIFFIYLKKYFSYEKKKNQIDQKRKDDLLSNISHEIRTPLTSIKGYLQMLLLSNDNLSRESQSYLSRIENNVSRLSVFFDDILNLSSLEQKLTINIEEIQVKDFVENIIKDLSMKYIEKKISITTDLSIESIGADFKLLQYIFINIIDNAFKYSKQNGSIHLSWKKLNKDLVLLVIDNGIGIEEKNISRVFERFYRVDFSRSANILGAGLGLAIVKHALLHLDGKIKIESKIDNGTMVEVIFPLDSINLIEKG